MSGPRREFGIFGPVGPPIGSLAEVQIAVATADDCRAIAEVQVRSWQFAYRDILPAAYLASLSVSERESKWCRVIENKRSHVQLAQMSRQVIGFVSYGPSRDDDAPSGCAEVYAIYVHPSFLSTGVGCQLWLAALQQVRAEDYKTITLWVIAGNDRAVRFYERAGFLAEPGSRKQFRLGGIVLDEVRYARGEAE